MKHGCIIMDFDHTIFDATAFKAALAASILKYGINRDIFWQTYRELRERDFEYSPSRHLAVLARTVKLNKTLIKKNIDKVIANSRQYLYPNAVQFLTKIYSLGAPLILLSRGDRDFQNKKITACGIKNFFSEIIIVKKSKNTATKNLAAKYGHGAIFINDNLDETLEALQTAANIKPIIKNRNNVPAPERRKQAIPNFNTLNEIKKYILLKYGK